ncbi:MAG: YchF family ATPase [Dehalococcoidia bacterium]|nr:YchF family ATPase [Dehalococcoidia bacterium]
MEIGIIGFPQSGKTTLFHALARGRVESASQGSGRRDVHAGTARMADRRLDSLGDIIQPDKVTPAEVKYWDVPAGSGDGFGGRYLTVLQGADALLHVVRQFQDPSVAHVKSAVDPVRDVADMEAELALSDLAILERRLERIEAQQKGARAPERDSLTRESALLQRLKDGLEQGVPVRRQEAPDQMADVLSGYQFLTAKPLLTVVNTGEDGPGDGMDRVAIGGPGTECTSLSARLEMELTQLSPDDEEEFRASMGMTESGLDRVVRMSLRLLSLVSFFTYVSREVRAWTVPEDTPAVKAAGRIHTDMERGFIRAEVVSFDDLSECGSLAQCKKQGLLRLEGKGYSVKDGDVITFLFNT